MHSFTRYPIYLLFPIASLMAHGAFAAGLDAGDFHTCGWLRGSQAKCWGASSFGQLGQGDTAQRGDAPNEMGAALAIIDLGAGRTPRQIASGAYHSCVLLDSSEVKCWGRNSSGQLGLADTADRGNAASEMGDLLPVVDLGSGRTAVAVAAGAAHTCALLDNAQVKCWGHNGFGQLGLGDTANRGDAAGEMGDLLPAVDLGAGRTAIKLAAGGYHTCAQLDTGDVKCWGGNFYGQLGLGDVANRGDATNEMGDFLPVVNLGSGRSVRYLAASGVHNCAVLDNDDTKCWGRNDAGQLGLGDTVNRGDGVNEMGDLLPAVNLGTGRHALKLAAGGAHSCALLDDGTMKCWGLNRNGQLGQGDVANRGDAANEMGDLLPAIDLGAGRGVIKLAVGLEHSCALLDDDSIKCWGDNLFGQLGLGDTADRGDAPSEMGDLLPAVDL